MFGPSKKETELNQQLVESQRQVQQFQESRENVKNWTSRLEAENEQKEKLIKRQREEIVAMSIKLDGSQRELETLQANVKQITQEPMPFFETGLLSIRFDEIVSYQADEKGNLWKVNQFDLSHHEYQYVPITLAVFKGLLAAYYRGQASEE